MCRLHVGAVGQLGLLDRAQHGRHSGEVHDGVDAAAERLGEHFGIRQVTLHDLHGRVGVRLEIDDTHMRAIGRQLGNHVPADESGSSRDEDATAVQGVGGRSCTHNAQAGSTGQHQTVFPGGA